MKWVMTATSAFSPSGSQPYLQKILKVISDPIKTYNQPDITVVVQVFVDIVNLAAHSCCGFDYIIGDEVGGE